MLDTGERLIPEGHTQTLTYGEHLARYNAALPLVKGKVVLDVASGTGYGSQLLAAHAKSVQGLDYSEEAVEYAQEHFSAPNLEYKVGDAQAMPFADRLYDVVISLETIEHLPDPAKFIAEVKRVLKPGGVFVVSTPNDDEFMDGNEFHVHEFQFPELERLITTNFKKKTYYYQGTYFAAGVFTKDRFINGRPSAENLPTTVTFGQPENKAIYFIAVASDSSEANLALDESVVIADCWSTKDDMERDKARTEHVTNLKQNITDLDERLTTVSAELHTIKASRAWRLICFLRNQKTKVTKVGSK